MVKRVVSGGKGKGSDDSLSRKWWESLTLEGRLVTRGWRCPQMLISSDRVVASHYGSS